MSRAGDSMVGGTDILSWERNAARIVGFTTSGSKGSTTVKIEMCVTSAWELGDLIRRLAELRDLPDPLRTRKTSEAAHG